MAKFEPVKTLKDAVDFYFKNPAISVPFLILFFVWIFGMWLFSTLFGKFIFSLTQFSLLSALTFPFKSTQFLVLLFFWFFIYVIIESIAIAATILKTQKPNLSLLEALKQGFYKMPILILVSIIYGLIVAAGLILFIVPGIYLGIRLLLCYPAVVLGKGLGLNESWKLTKGYFWELFVLAFILFVFGLVALLPLIGRLISLLFIKPIGTVAWALAYLRLKK
ncbi:MAG: hypothetical protein ACP5IJ_02425 [Candidatus Nanoarchaeia archaeon]